MEGRGKIGRDRATGRKECWEKRERTKKRKPFSLLSVSIKLSIFNVFYIGPETRLS